MNVKERYLAAYRRQPVDRVPIALSYYHAGFSRKHFPRLREGQDPVERSIQNQLRYGFDPHAYVRGTADWQLARPNAGEEPPGYTASGEWRVTQAATREPTGAIRTDYRIETPGGELSCVRVQEPDDFGTIEEPFIKCERDIELLRYRPHPRTIVHPDLIRQDARAMGERCWAMASITGVWGLASFLRGPVRIMYDCYDRPEWVKRFLGVLGDYQVELVKAIGQAGADITLRIDGSFIGFGLSRAMFSEFIQPDDTRIVQAAHDAGTRVHFHICGKKNAFLEQVADMGIDALETLTPPSAAGDVDLSDAKRRIGDRVCLMGGFTSHILTFGSPSEVEAEVRRCLKRAAPGGGYILSPSGRIDPETPEENLLAFVRAGKRGITWQRGQPALPE
jgi:uroporphyrinogen decarboxylase